MEDYPLALIVEDEEDLAAIFSRVLEMAKFKTEIALDGGIALERLETIAPHLVVLDLHLPQISGIEVLQKIRANERLAETRIVIVTADLIQAEAWADQVDATLIKPIRINQLLEVANRLYPS
jgi:CheY-like chemotaxis protein